jgi:hypothetical protein
MDRDKNNHAQETAASSTENAAHSGQKVDLETSKHTDTPGEKTGEGDRTDTDEMHELNKDA